jgi:hypothetical protein
MEVSRGFLKWGELPVVTMLVSILSHGLSWLGWFGVSYFRNPPFNSLEQSTKSVRNGWIHHYLSRNLQISILLILFEGPYYTSLMGTEVEGSQHWSVYNHPAVRVDFMNWTSGGRKMWVFYLLLDYYILENMDKTY